MDTTAPTDTDIASFKRLILLDAPRFKGVGDELDKKYSRLDLGISEQFGNLSDVPRYAAAAMFKAICDLRVDVPLTARKAADRLKAAESLLLLAWLITDPDAGEAPPVSPWQRVGWNSRVKVTTRSPFSDPGALFDWVSPREDGGHEKEALTRFDRWCVRGWANVEHPQWLERAREAVKLLEPAKGEGAGDQSHAERPKPRETVISDADRSADPRGRVGGTVAKEKPEHYTPTTQGLLLLEFLASCKVRVKTGAIGARGVGQRKRTTELGELEKAGLVDRPSERGGWAITPAGRTIVAQSAQVART